jgi:hypothetical protein
MSKLEVFSRSYPEGARKPRKTAHGWFFRASDAGHARLSIHSGLEPFIGSCETSTMGNSGFGTVAIVFDSAGNQIAPYNIIQKTGGGHAAFFQSRELWEGTLTKISCGVEMMSFHCFDTTEVEAIMRGTNGLVLLKKWVRAHNNRKGVIKLDMPDGPTSFTTWRALDALVTLRPGIPEKKFLAMEFSGKISEALKQKACTPNELVYSDITEFKQCSCERYLKEGITCRCKKLTKSYSENACMEGQATV